jgi:hypothetical protein
MRLGSKRKTKDKRKWEASQKRAEERARERSATLAKLRGKLSPQQLEEAENRAQESAIYAQKFSRLNLELILAVPGPTLEAASRRVGALGTEPLPSCLAERLVVIRRLLLTLNTDTVDE